MGIFHAKSQYKCTEIITYSTVITEKFVIKCINFKLKEKFGFFSEK